MGGGSDDDDQKPETVALRKRTPAPAAHDPADTAPTQPGAGAPPTGDFAETLPPGTLAGRYVLLSRLGAGGAGLVYAAYDPQLDRKVAIKILRADEKRDASRGRARLLREGQAMARLKHPHVLPVYDVGTLDHPRGSRVFMAMELVDGGTLRAWLKERHSRREILAVMTACGRALEAAHAEGMVHRDFKPDNVLIDGGGRVFVTDFGLVRAAGDSTPIEVTPAPPTALTSPLTDVDTMLGTPGYMAPEQYRGQPTDARADQFSFCVTLFEALTGKHLFVGRTMAEQEEAALGPGFVAALRAAKVPAWIERVLERGLAPEREARFPTMTALLSTLENDPARRARRIGLAAAVVAGAALVLAGASRLVRDEGRICAGGEQHLAGIWDAPVRERVRQAFTRAGVPQLFDGAAALLDGYARDFVREHRDACEATRVRGEQSDGVLALRMSCLDNRRKELAALTALLADADRSAAFAAADAVSKLTSIRSCGDVSALTAPIPPPTDALAKVRVAELRARLAEGKVLADAGRFTQAHAALDEVLRDEERLRYGPLRAEALEQMARVHEDEGKLKDGQRALLDAAALAYAGHDDRRVASSLTALGMLEAYWFGAHEDGERWIRLAQSAIRRLGGSDELEAERGRVAAEIAIGEDDGAAAIAAGEPALKIAERVWGPVSVRAATFHSTLGAAYATNGDETQARAHYERQRDILVQLVGADHPLVAMALNNLGMNAEAQSRLEEAEHDLRTSATLLDKAFGPEHPRVAIALTNLGMVLRKRKKAAEAVAAFDRALAINEKRFGPDYVDSLDALLGKGESLLQLSRPREALEPIGRALSLCERTGGSRWGLAEARFALAQALWASDGDRARARKLAVQARQGMAEETNAIAHEQLAEIDAWVAAHR